MTLLDARHVAVALVGAVAVAVTGTPVHAAADDPAGAHQADRLEVQFGEGYVMPAGPAVRLGAWTPDAQSGKANTNKLLPMLGRSSGVSRANACELPDGPVLIATYCRPSTA